MELNITFVNESVVEPDAEEIRVLVCGRHLGNLVRASGQKDFFYEEISYLNKSKFLAADSLDAAKDYILAMYKLSGPGSKRNNRKPSQQ